MFDSPGFVLTVFILIFVSLGYTIDKWLRKIHESLEGIRKALKRE